MQGVGYATIKDILSTNEIQSVLSMHEGPLRKVFSNEFLSRTVSP